MNPGGRTVILFCLLLMGITLTVCYPVVNFNSDDPLFSQAQTLSAPVSRMISARPQGELLHWNEARSLFPQYVMATIIDVETGKSFEAERRGGSSHADVQPLTLEDTKVLRELYPTGWSWRRRAVVVEVGRNRIAASMNGMPHGSGKIQGNDFQGHFCLHFLGSKVHISKKIDPAHQLMVYKAAGQPEQLFLLAGPEEVLNLVITAWNQGDPGLASLGLSFSGESDLWFMEIGLSGLYPEIYLQKTEFLAEGSNETEQRFRVKAALYYPGERIRRVREDLILVKKSASGSWFVDGDCFQKLISDEDKKSPAVS